MISLLEYAFLSGTIYWPEGSIYFGKYFTPIEFKKIDFSTNGWWLLDDIPNRPAFTNNFQAALFVKFAQGKPTDAVVSIRGTVFSKVSNLLVDTEAWISDVIGNGKSLRIPAYLHLAQRFFSAAKNYMRHKEFLVN